jgi:predicted membrane protein
MDYKKVFWGVLFILIGLLFVLKNLNILDFSWYQFLNLWPLLLILWGIAMLPIKGFVKLILSLAMVVMGVYLVNKYDRGYWFEFNKPRSYEYRYDDRSERRESRRDRQREAERSETEWDTQYLFFPYSSDINKATLKLDAAAGTFRLNETSDELIEVEKEGNIGSYSLTSQEGRDSYIVRLSMEEASLRGERLRHQVDIKLHEKPVWDLELNIGAARIDMDLSPFKANNIKVDGGASSIRMKLGELQPEINVEVNAGASSIVIEVPENSGCQVRTSSVLSGKDMRDFKRLNGGRYETENFEESENKIFIKVDVAVSKIEVRRY